SWPRRFIIASPPQQPAARLDSGDAAPFRSRRTAGHGAERGMTIRIAMWSGPRNISTAMMRAWGGRADTEVMDEPFYAAYLAATGLDHPMRDAVLASQPTDWDAVAEDCARRGGAAVLYQKHMAQHMIAGAPLGWMSAVRHGFLIRPPAEVAASFGEKWQ